MSPFYFNYKSKFSLVAFDTTKGHFGRTEVYQRCVDDLRIKGCLNEFRNLIVHIKIDPTPKGEEQFVEMSSFYRALGFIVISTRGEWKHESQSMQSEYSKDLIRVYGDEIVPFGQYILHYESDWKLDF
jgi:hypothetical protein